MKLNYILVSVSLLFSSCSIIRTNNEEKAVVEISGPTTFAIEGFTDTFYRLPKSLSEVADYIEWRETYLPIENESKKEKKAWKEFSRALRQQEESYSWQVDSAFYYKTNGRYYEEVSVYDPRVILEQFPYLSPNERIEMTAGIAFIPHFYDGDGMPIYYPDFEELSKSINDLRNGCDAMICRLIDGEKWPYRTIFTAGRSKEISFYRLRLPDSESICSIFRDEKDMEIISEDDVSVLCSDFLSKLSVVTDACFKEWPDVQTIIFVTILMK